MESAFFSDLVQDIIQTSGKLATQFGCEYVDSEFLLLAIIDESLKNPESASVLFKTFKHLNIDIFHLIGDIEHTFDSTKPSLKIEKIPLTNKVNLMLKMSFLEAKLLQSSYRIEAEHILLAYLRIGSDFSENKLAVGYNLTYDRVKDFIMRL